MNIVEWEEENMRSIADRYDGPSYGPSAEECKLCIYGDSDGVCTQKVKNWCFTCHGEKFERKEDC